MLRFVREPELSKVPRRGTLGAVAPRVQQLVD
jgi:hypothetical protein